MCEVLRGGTLRQAWEARGVAQAGGGKGRALRWRNSREESLEAGGAGMWRQQVVLCGSEGWKEAGRGSCGLTDLVSLSRSLKIKVRLAHCCKIREHRKLFLKRKYNP